MFLFHNFRPCLIKQMIFIPIKRWFPNICQVSKSKNRMNTTLELVSRFITSVSFGKRVLTHGSPRKRLHYVCVFRVAVLGWHADRAPVPVGQVGRAVCVVFFWARCFHLHGYVRHIHLLSFQLNIFQLVFLFVDAFYISSSSCSPRLIGAVVADGLTDFPFVACSAFERTWRLVFICSRVPLYPLVKVIGPVQVPQVRPVAVGGVLYMSSQLWICEHRVSRFHQPADAPQYLVLVLCTSGTWPNSPCRTRRRLECISGQHWRCPLLASQLLTSTVVLAAVFSIGYDSRFFTDGTVSLGPESIMTAIFSYSSCVKFCFSFSCALMRQFNTSVLNGSSLSWCSLVLQGFTCLHRGCHVVTCVRLHIQCDRFASQRFREYRERRSLLRHHGCGKCAESLMGDCFR